MTFTIKKDKHYANFRVGITFKKQINYTVTLTSSCLYTITGEDYYDINKLVGFANVFNHHNQSARFGWRCINGNQFEILTYTYDAGKRVETADTVLGVVNPDQPFCVSIEDTGEYYRYYFGYGKTSAFQRYPKEKKRLRLPFHWLLHPFFGGTTAAPHEMKIELTKD